jgi:MFS family permease
VRLDWKGPSLTDRLSDLLGRKWTLYALWVILALVRAASYPIALTAVSCSRERRKDLASMAGRKAFVGIGVGTLQATVAPYICRCIESRLPQLLTVSGEWSPVILRGALIMWYSIWFSIGGFFGPVMLQVISTYAPDNWRTPVLTQWGLLGMMLAIFVFLPESPCE